MRQLKFTRDKLAWNVLTVISFSIFAFFFLFPLFRMICGSIWTGQGFNLEPFKRFFATKYYLQAVFNSFKVSTVTTFIAICTGTAFAMIMRYYKIKGKKIVDILLLVSTITPPFLGGYSWILLFGRVGWATKFLNKLFNVTLPGVYGFWGIVFTFVCHSTMTMYMYISGALKNVDATLNEAAANLGCFGLRRIVKIILPLILPTVLSTALLTFMHCFADYGTAALIGEGYNVMGTLIYTAFLGEVSRDASMAAAMASITLIFTTLLFILQRYIASRRIVEMNSLHPIEQKEPKGFVAFITHFYIYLLTLLAILPIFIVAYNSFQRASGFLFLPGYSLDSYRIALTRLGSAIQRTYLYGLIAILVIVVIAVIISYANVRQRSVVTKTADTLTVFPLVVPGTVLGIAMVLAFNGAPFYLNGTAILVIAVWVIRRLPYTVRSTTGVLHNISVSVEEAAQSLGANPLRTFRRVTFPLIFSGVLPGALLSFIASITELSASLMIYNFRTVTMSIKIYTEICKGNFGVASAMSTILLLSAVLVLGILFKVSKGNYEFTL